MGLRVLVMLSSLSSAFAGVAVTLPDDMPATDAVWLFRFFVGALIVISTVFLKKIYAQIDKLPDEQAKMARKLGRIESHLRMTVKIMSEGADIGHRKTDAMILALLEEVEREDTDQ